jgi:hypothetical protein
MILYFGRSELAPEESLISQLSRETYGTSWLCFLSWGVLPANLGYPIGRRKMYLLGGILFWEVILDLLRQKLIFWAMSFLSYFNSYPKRSFIRRELKAVMRLLFSINTYEIDGLIQLTKAADGLRKIKNYIIIKFAVSLEYPPTDDDIGAILSEQAKAAESYFFSDETRRLMTELKKTETESAMLKFNFLRGVLKEAHSENEFSKGGLYFAKSNVVGRPLSKKEKVVLDEHYKNIAKANADYKAATDNFIENMNKLHRSGGDT